MKRMKQIELSSAQVKTVAGGLMAYDSFGSDVMDGGGGGGSWLGAADGSYYTDQGSLAVGTNDYTSIDPGATCTSNPNDIQAVYDSLGGPRQGQTPTAVAVGTRG